MTVPRLAHVDTREQQLYSKPPPDLLTPHPISEAEPSPLVLFLFGHNPELMTTGEMKKCIQMYVTLISSNNLLI